MKGSTANNHVTQPLTAPNISSCEKLFELIRSTGIPLSSDPSASELDHAIERIRGRRRRELLQFLGRVIARDLHNSKTGN